MQAKNVMVGNVYETKIGEVWCQVQVVWAHPAKKADERYIGSRPEPMTFTCKRVGETTHLPKPRKASHLR